MNRNLFEVRNLGRKPILLLIGLLLGVVFVFFIYQFKENSNSNFLKFHGKKDYAPLKENEKGLYGKINNYLKEALADRSNIKYDITKLDSLYNRLRFYYPADTANYLVSVDDIRLIDFIPNTGNKEESIFYFNSDFRNVIEKQKTNLTQKYFNIEWNKEKDSIISITIDTTLFNLSLQNDNWNGEIRFKDPFSEIDSRAKYLITENNVIPLFSTNADSNNFYKFILQYDTLDPLRKEKFSVNDYEYLYRSLNNQDAVRSKALLLNYLPGKDKLHEFSIRFINTGDKIFLQSQAIDLRIYGGKQSIAAVHDTTIAILADFDILKIELKLRGVPSQYKIYISNISPFSISSKPLNGGITSERLQIDTSYLDLFSTQQLQQLESGISVKDSIKSVELSTNLVLSKYLEKKIKEELFSLTSNKALCQRSDDVFEMSVCLMDISTGEVIAAPFYSNEFEKNNINETIYQRNFNLIRHDIGSTFKPLISSAACLKYKCLAEFQLLPGNTHFITDTNCIVLGYPTIGYGFDRKTKTAKTLFWPRNPINRPTFLSQSHDNYPIALSMLALTEDADPAYTLLSGNHLNNIAANNLFLINGNETSRILYKPNNRRTVFKDISNSSFINMLSNLYDVEAESKDSTYNIITYDSHSWDKLKTKRKTLYSLYPDIVYLGTDKFGHVNSGLEDFKKFELFVLGQGDNLWTNIKLAEAYCRLLSKRKIVASFLKSDDTAFPNLFDQPNLLFQSSNNKHYRFNVTSIDMCNSWDSFMHDWRVAVQMNNPLLRAAYNKFSNGVADYDDYYFYCKTGTPQENNEHDNNKVFKKGKLKVWWDEGIFVFGATNKNNNYPKGIVGVVYIKHLSLDKIEKGVESSTARDFLTPAIFEKIMFYNQNRFSQ